MRLEVAQRDDEFPGWVRVVTGDRNEGWAPEVILQENGEARAVAVRGYSARELDVEVGDVLVGLEVVP